MHSALETSLELAPLDHDPPETLDLRESTERSDALIVLRNRGASAAGRNTRLDTALVG